MPTYKFKNKTTGVEWEKEMKIAKLDDYVKLISPSLSRDKADNLFISMLESLDPREAKILNAAKNKKLFVRGLSRKLAVKVWGNRIFS